MDIKEVFISRFANGVIMEADYSSLEVCVLAWLSQDEQLINDIITGKDMHKIRAAELFNKPEDAITKNERQYAKYFSFELQYGAGAKSMAEKHLVSEELTKQFITNYYNRYPQVKEWQDRNINLVKANKKPARKRTPKGQFAHIGYLVSPTKRRYIFTEYDAPEFLHAKQIRTSFSPTEIKNYPVQGLATADIVPIMLGILYRKLLPYRDDCKLINTVHDSVLLDVKEELINEIGLLTKQTLESVPEIMEKYFNLNWNIPLKVEVEVGKNWASKKPLILN